MLGEKGIPPKCRKAYEHVKKVLQARGKICLFG